MLPEMPTKSTSAPADVLKDKMHRSLETVGRELEKLELLAAAMAAFSQPVPEYEYSFQHQRHLTASATTLRNRLSL